MASVGAFPGFRAIRRRTVRAAVNPLDKSTIVSIYPRPLHEVKHTITPGRFDMLPGSEKEPQLLVVGPSSWWKEIDEEQPLLEIPNSSIQVADSIVKDYCNGLLGCNMSTSMPGIFWVPGEFDIAGIKKHPEHSLKFARAASNQKTYFTTLCNIADSLWARTNGNPLVISDDMRMAARSLDLAKDWMKDFTATETQIKCVACGHPRNKDFPVCPNCKAVIDHDLAIKLGIKFAL